MPVATALYTSSINLPLKRSVRVTIPEQNNRRSPPFNMRPLAVYSFLFTTVLSFVSASQSQDCGCGDIAQYPLVYPVFTSKVGQYNCSCQPKRAGQLKFADGKLFVCTGTEWKAVQFEQSVSYGSESNPGSSCKDIKSKNPTLSDGIYWITLSGSKDPFPVYCDMVAGGWTMVFKAVSGTGTDVYNTYTSKQTYSEKVMAALDVTKRHHSHYKNRIVLKWKTFGASEARVALYKGKNMMKELKFNAKGSDKLNWFSFSRLIQSPWSDIKTEPKNFFSIIGDPRANRYFFMNRNYGTCSTDVGWMVITGTVCNWEKYFKRNIIIYSKLSGNTKWIDYNNVAVADTLVVYLR